MQFPSYDMCSSMLLLKFFVYPKQDSAHRDHKRSEHSSSGRLQDVKNNGKSLNRQWSRSLTGGDRVREVPTVRLNWGGFGVLDRWSLTRVGRLWRFDCISVL